MGPKDPPITSLHNKVGGKSGTSHLCVKWGESREKRYFMNKVGGHKPPGEGSPTPTPPPQNGGGRQKIVKLGCRKRTKPSHTQAEDAAKNNRSGIVPRWLQTQKNVEFMLEISISLARN